MSDLDVINPSNEQIIKRVECATKDDVRHTIDEAREFFDGCRWTAKERSKILLNVSHLVKRHSEELATLESLNTGMPLREARKRIESCRKFLNYYARLSLLPDEEDNIRYEPIGVVSAIVPWNFPLLMAVWKIAPSLAAGNATILKPSSHTPLTALKLVELFEKAGCPKGALNVVVGGAMVGRELCSSKNVDKISFTGSTETAKEIVKLSSSNLKKLTLECGGKCA